ncbi:replication initiation protein RepC [Rhizobium sp. ARZ01]|uniref:plasmid replication protein RepC n=1 Tax=Rhizobium sp. ARZ01 TaxID=2769313 RepID=UPI001785CD86|nr:plasmid replication protein RepC [Rhizobium sp. ARZ01]MBD9375124.1 replication initiation protein RepC [Rhizobium sp. ARZ01]
MTDRLATTPFGGGRMTARLFAMQRRVSETQAKLAEAGGNETGTAEKWQLLRALTEARTHYGLSDRTIAVLEALLSFYPEKVLDGRTPIVVFPSNAELSVRSRGMSPATLRRHLAQLLATGMLIRRDSPNGKRYCRRDDRGVVEDAFGFDLAPLALMAHEIHEQAELARTEARRYQALRAEVTLHLRDVAKVIEAALSEGRAGPWLDHQFALAELSGRLGRSASTEALTERKLALISLRCRVEEDYLNSLSNEEMSGNDLQDERHIQNSNSDPSIELNGNESKQAEPSAEGTAPERKGLAISLKRVLAVCPEIRSYAKDGVATWAEFIKAAALVRSMLGISPDAYEKARAAMGDGAAAVVIAAMLERSDQIRSPGGYLRELTRKAEAGQFSVLPMIKALE